jgi:hypothetical protein
MVKPDKVVDPVVRAIEKDTAEMVVMAGPGRLLKALMDLLPGSWADDDPSKRLRSGSRSRG